MTSDDVVLDVSNLRKAYGDFLAVDDVSFQLRRGASLAVVGESGSGKTTVARMIMGLVSVSDGVIAACERDRSSKASSAADRRRRGREVQMVFQDPYASLDPRWSAEETIMEVLQLHHPGQRATAHRERVEHLLGSVGLDARQGRALPRDLSGGQRQRVAIARALAADPTIIILDEAVAALDVSIQAQILNLLSDVRAQTGVSFLFVSHDLAVVRAVSDHTVVMQRGRIVERGPTAQLLDDPQDPYTRLLRDSVPRPGWTPKRRERVA